VSRDNPCEFKSELYRTKPEQVSLLKEEKKGNHFQFPFGLHNLKKKPIHNSKSVWLLATGPR
jgi:hypothetical protein